MFNLKLNISGVKTRMKDQFRARQVALWLNLVPDLVCPLLPISLFYFNSTNLGESLREALLSQNT